jgi:hypothetical protein
MRKRETGISRRRDLLRIAAAAALGAGGLSGYLSRALAAARIPLPAGVREIKGEVFINNRSARVNQLVQPGDVVTTGRNSQVMFVLGRDAYLLRANTRFEVRGQRELPGPDGKLREAIVQSLHVVNGAVLAVFGRGKQHMVLPNVTLGIRGTGVYVEVENGRDYVCTCYGKVKMISRLSDVVRETVSTSHHEAPRFITGGSTPRIVKAPVRNHTDAELVMLEALVGREPPFGTQNTGYNYY